MFEKIKIIYNKTLLSELLSSFINEIKKIFICYFVVGGSEKLTIAEKKTELEKYRDLWKDIKCLEDDILRLESAAEKVTSIISDLPRVQSSKDKMVVVDDIIIKKEKLQQKISEAMAKREYIENAIDRVDNSLYRRVLRYRYINGASFEEISVKENYNYKYITSTIHPKALECIEFDSLI